MEYISIDDIIYFGVTTSNPSGGALTNTDVTPRWYTFLNGSDTIIQQGDLTLRTNLIGTYRGNTTVSLINGYSSGDYCEVHVSGTIGGILGRAIVKSFVIDDLYKANVTKIDGVVAGQAIVKANIVQISGTQINYSDLVPNDLYYANIKFIRDSTVIDDEYTVNWFKNATPLESGQVTNAALTIYKTSDSTSLFTNKVLNYYSVNHGALRYNEPTNIQTSGEPYLAVASGTINGSTRLWKNLVGLDYLS